MTAETLTVKVQGDFALFTRPEFSAERVSYQVMTPSAARGILEAIFWKPEMRWRVQKIHVLKPIRQFSILRNEVNSHQSDRAARSWDSPGDGYFAEDDRAQRHSLCLRDVAYVIEAAIDLKAHATDNIVKYREMFRRRVEKGQCFNQPYLGTREFSAYFEPLDGEKTELEGELDLGWMLFDLEFSELPKVGKISYRTHNGEGSRVVQGAAMPKFFHAKLVNGVLEVPQSLYAAISGGRG
ncbi:MAG: type I-C CRISPR-associated protein Cas5 [Alkalinema sp. RU_4_3]|nr:type I-C CRISPR-associated protein Cas5 [Alkalinema sp. RU_4_3]